MDELSLPPDLEQFAAEAVASGRYRDRIALVTAGVSLLQRQEQARAELQASVLAAQEEGDREGYITGDELLARIEERLARRSSSAA